MVTPPPSPAWYDAITPVPLDDHPDDWSWLYTIPATAGDQTTTTPTDSTQWWQSVFLPTPTGAISPTPDSNPQLYDIGAALSLGANPIANPRAAPKDNFGLFVRTEDKAWWEAAAGGADKITWKQVDLWVEVVGQMQLLPHWQMTVERSESAHDGIVAALRDKGIVDNASLAEIMGSIYGDLQIPASRPNEGSRFEFRPAPSLRAYELTRIDPANIVSSSPAKPASRSWTDSATFLDDFKDAVDFAIGRELHESIVPYRSNGGREIVHSVIDRNEFGIRLGAAAFQGSANFIYDQFLKEDTNSTVGAPGTWEGMIPVWGSGRTAINAGVNGRYGSMVLNGVLAGTDVFVVTKIVGTGLKFGYKLGVKETVAATVKEGATAAPANAKSLRIASAFDNMGSLVAGAPLTESQAAILSRLDAAGGKLTLRTGELTTTDLAALTAERNTEFAVVRTTTGERQLIQLGRMGGELPAGTRRLIIHSHPGDRRAILHGVSGEDVRALDLLGQLKSLIVNSEGTVASFGLSGEPTILKQYLFGTWQYTLRP